jgi:hypothetical protein
MNTDNFFRHVEVIEARDAQSLASKLKSIKQVFQLNQVWSDGKKHYALINPGRKLPAKVIEELAKDPQ